MNKGMLYAGLGLGAAAIGYLAYRFMLTPTQAYATSSLNPNSGPTSFTTDPYQSYPFQANTPPRVDNSNQPWANNNRGSIAQVSSPNIDVNLSNVQMIANYAKAGNEIAQGFSGLWDTLGVNEWFSSDDPTGFVDVADYTLWNEDTGLDYNWNEA